MLEQGIPMAQICREQEFPMGSIYYWMEQHKDVAERIARARDVGYDIIAQSCLEIADNAAADTYEDEHGNIRTNTEVVQRSKLRVWTRLELLKKWDPKRYGDSLKVDADIKVSRADEIRKARERAAKK
jgi:hypothetical protein